MGKKQNGHCNDEQKEANDVNSCIWYAPNSHLYFESVSIDKSKSKKKALHETKAFDHKKKKFYKWHQHKLKEIATQNNKKRNPSPHINVVQSAINSMIPSMKQQQQQTANGNSNNNLQPFITLNGFNQQSNAATQYAAIQQQYSLTAAAQQQNGTNPAAAAQAANAYYAAAYRAQTANGTATSNQQTQQQHQVQYAHPASTAYYQYGGSTPTGYVAMSNGQGGATSYVMDNRTGSIYAAIPANYAHHSHQNVNVNINGMQHPTAAYTNGRGQVQYVSMPMNANGQSTVVAMTNSDNMQLPVLSASSSSVATKETKASSKSKQKDGNKSKT